MQPAENFIIPWHENLHGHSDSFLDTILDEAVTFHSPVVFRPIEGIFDDYTLSDDGTRVVMPVGNNEIVIDKIN